MAKWGEGDPRWIVEERPDATNVNNWHWTEKNATPWSKEKLRALLLDFVVDEGGALVSVTEVEKLEGESSANNRKGKLIFFYEWNIVVKWQGVLPGEDTPGTGKLTIPNLSEENDLADIDVQVTVDESNEVSERLKEFLYNVGRDKVRELLGVYVRELREEFSKGMILPKKDGSAPPAKPDGVSNIKSGFNKKITIDPVVSSQHSKASGGHKIDVVTITASERFQCQANALYDALTRVEMVTAFTRAHVKMDPVKGGDFAYFGGNVSGKFQELVPSELIRQTWRLKQWPEGHFSTVLMKIEEMDDHTVLTLTQTGVPAAEEEVTRNNWKRYYWDSIKQTFGFGSFLG
ncbi:activator of 90 kDa heat shock protein ATPase homolog 1 [Phlebotomus argentipes]|uniref:activator of 90 kDa heat shock protein ATPase homolog 1 n=1 Tax=Phlebotomus argentipes TaxID=94469 RepID=UPI0028931AEE|nr:activator of 90 kDa heat shock protein ATPase homolog 1 [Phlebotomus argentipes]